MQGCSLGSYMELSWSSFWGEYSDANIKCKCISNLSSAEHLNKTVDDKNYVYFIYFVMVCRGCFYPYVLGLLHHWYWENHVIASEAITITYIRPFHNKKLYNHINQSKTEQSAHLINLYMLICLYISGLWHFGIYTVSSRQKYHGWGQ